MKEKNIYGRVEVFHDKGFFDKYSSKGVGAVVGRFTCTTLKFSASNEFTDFCKWVCEQVYLAEGEITNLTKTQAEEMIQKKEALETQHKETIDLTDFEYITL